VDAIPIFKKRKSPIVFVLGRVLIKTHEIFKWTPNNFHLSKIGHFVNRILLNSTLQQFLSSKMEMGNTFTTDIRVCTFNTGITIIARLENYVGSTFGELLMGLPHSSL